MKKLLFLVPLLLVLVSCDNSAGPGNGGTPIVQASTYFPYQVGDSMTFEVDGFLENVTPFTDTFVQRVVRNEMIEGKMYQLHVLRGYNLQPFPDSIYWRVEGSKVYQRVIQEPVQDKQDYLYLDFSGDTTERMYVPLRKAKDTTFVTVPAGTFTLAVKMKSGSLANFTEIYAPGVGMLVQDLGRRVSVTRLVSAKIGGRSYP